MKLQPVSERYYRFKALLEVDANSPEQAEKMINRWLDAIADVQVEGVGWPECDWEDVTYE